MTEEEKWFSVCAMLVGIGLFFGFILGGMASMLTNLDSQRARYIHHLNVIKDHMVRTVSFLIGEYCQRKLGNFVKESAEPAMYTWNRNLSFPMRTWGAEARFSKVSVTFQARSQIFRSKSKE